MDKSLSTFNIAYGIRLYETMKKDLYTLLIKESKEVFDYDGNALPTWNLIRDFKPENE